MKRGREDKSHRGSRPSIIGRDLMTQFGLQLIQHTPGDQIRSIEEEPKGVSRQGAALDSWQDYFSEQFSKLFRKVGKIRN